MIRRMDRRRLIYFLLLNVFVSACVTGTILYWYDRNQKATLSVPAFAPQTQPQPAANVPAANPNSNSDIQIVSVVGADNLGAEVVILRYLGQGQLDLTNWQLKDENGNAFIFPTISLVKDGAVQVHTAGGTDTVIDLYWGMTAPVWSSGETASLYDVNGNLVVQYKVP